MVAFLKPKQEREALIEGKNEHLTHRIEDSDKELAIALGLKNEFISNINHEYNAPMTGIISMVQILRDHYDKFDDQVMVTTTSSLPFQMKELGFQELSYGIFSNHLLLAPKVTALQVAEVSGLP
ncbi:unnamed protein product, partial [Allacma fusca]